MRKKRIIVIILIFIVLCLVAFLLSYNKNELRTIRTEKELLNIYDNNDYYSYDNDLCVKFKEKSGQWADR